MPFLNMHKCLFNESGEWKDKIKTHDCLFDEANESDTNMLIEFLSSELQSKEWYE